MEMWVWRLAFLLQVFTVTRSEVFTALVDLEKLLHTQSEIITSLEGYLSLEHQRLQKVQAYVEEYEEMSRKASHDVEKFISNPVNAYLLVKRLSSDWRHIEELMLDSVGRAVLDNITARSDLEFPEDEDLSGAAIALTRLQDTYQLDTSSLARGEIQGVRYTAELTAGDCFELGRQSYHAGDHYHTVLWMQEALDRLEDEFNKTTTKSDILEYLAFSTYMQGNARHAIKLTHDLLEIVPNHPRARGNLDYYYEAVQESKQKKRGDDGDVPHEKSFLERLTTDEEEMPERTVYEKLCRGEKRMSYRTMSELTCQYVTNGNPYFVIGPLKQETAYKQPRIVIYYEVMHDTEIEMIKQLATPKLKRATVQNYKSGELEVAHYRISKSAWLNENEGALIQRINKRLEAITGLTPETAEDLQVVNYGIGGHYEPHYDFARREEKNAFKSLGTGNRIATFLYYMSTVDAGGATVFPNLGVSLWPKKGSAAFWYNLFPNGEGDLMTRHAACPVLAGSKWVSNKWFHERGQEFRRPCGPSLLTL